MLDTVTIHRARVELALDRGPAPAPAGAVTALGLTIPDLEELLVAVGDREDTATTDGRARLARGRVALELELARLLEE